MFLQWGPDGHPKTYLMQTRGNTVDDFKALIVRVFIRFGEVSV